jgi:hypothetical protein
MIDPVFKTQWVKAIRSGRYKRGEGALRRKVEVAGQEEIQYCCLGVGLNVAGNRHWKEQHRWSCSRGPHHEGQEIDFGTGGYSWDQTEKLGFVTNAVSTKLATMNDALVYDEEGNITGFQYSWDDIADWIEEKL